jgi:LysM repeat protein
MTSTTTTRWVRASLLVGAVLLALLCIPLLVAAQDGDQPMQTHVVQQGETAPGLAARYGVALAQLVEANNLQSLVLTAGTTLIIPAPPGQAGQIHLVRRWETLPQIAARYGVSAPSVMLANGLSRPGALYAGQRLLIPLPAPQPTPTAPACVAGCAQISISAPARDTVVTSPARVAGRGAAYEQALHVRVLDATGYEIGQGNAMIDGPPGAIGPFSGVITFTVPASTQPGRIQVYSQSPADGAVEQLASVLVMLQGAGLDEAVEQLKRALEDKSHDALAALMADPFSVTFYGAESLTMNREQALDQIRAQLLDPGQVFVDLSVDARRLAPDSFAVAANVTHVVFSTGWGPDRSDDALLLFSTDAAGRARWSGMIYIFGALRPY